MSVADSNSINKIAKKRKNKWYKDRDYLQLLSLSFIPALMVFIFNYIPMFGVIIAFKDYKYNLGILGSKFVGLKNFKVFVCSDLFKTLARNTVLNNLLFISTGMIAAVIVAMLLYEITSRKATKTFQTIIIIPNFISWVMVSYIVYSILAPGTGIADAICKKFGLPTVSWYSKPSVWPIILCIVNIWKHFGMDSILYYAALMGVDEEMIEAAKVDGASKLTIMFKILLPQIIPIIVILAILAVGRIFRGDFGLFYNVTRDVGVLYPTTDVFDTYIFRVTRVDGSFGLGAAAGLLQSAVGFVLVVIVNKISNKISPDYGLF